MALCSVSLFSLLARLLPLPIVRNLRPDAHCSSVQLTYCCTHAQTYIRTHTHTHLCVTQAIPCRVMVTFTDLFSIGRWTYFVVGLRACVHDWLCVPDPGFAGRYTFRLLRPGYDCVLSGYSLVRCKFSTCTIIWVPLGNMLWSRYLTVWGVYDLLHESFLFITIPRQSRFSFGAEMGFHSSFDCRGCWSRQAIVGPDVVRGIYSRYILYCQPTDPSSISCIRKFI